MSIFLDLFFSPDRTFAFVLNVLILTLMVIAVGRALVVVFQVVPRERQVLAGVEAITGLSREKAQAAVKGSGSIIEARVDDLARFHAVRQPIDPAALTGLTTSTLRSQLAAAEGIGRSLIVLGLLGTLWGLGAAVTSLTATISPGGMNVQALAEAILNTLGGLQTAFGTTLVGLFGALVVGFTAGVARQHLGSLLRDFERVMATRLVPLFDTSDAKNLSDAAKALEDMERRVAEDMQSILAKIGTEGAELRKRLEEDFTRLEDAFEERAQQLIRATGTALESTLSIIGERREGEPTLAEYVRTVRSTVDMLESSIQSAGALIPALEERLIATINRQRTGLEEVFSRHEQAMEPLLARQSESLDMLAGVASRNVTTSEGLASALDRFAARLEEARTGWAALDEKIVEVGRSCQEGIQSGLRSVVAELRQDQHDSSEERERIARHLATFEAELRRHLEHLVAERSRVIAQMTELVEVMREAVAGAVRQVGDGLGERERATAHELRLAVENLSRELRGVLPTIAGGPTANADGHRTDRSHWNRTPVAPVIRLPEPAE